MCLRNVRTVFCIAVAILSSPVSAFSQTTRDQAVSNSAPYTALSDKALSAIIAYYTTMAATGALTPQQAISNAISFTALDDKSLSAIIAWGTAYSIPPISGARITSANGFVTDYPTVESAFAKAVTSDFIELAPQTFVMGSGVTMPTNATLKGYNTTIIWTNVQTDLSTNGACVVLSDNCQVKDIFFNDTNTADASAFKNFVSRTSGSATNWLISGCRFEGVIDCLVFCTNRMQGTIRDCRFGSGYDELVVDSPNGSSDPRTTNTFDIVIYNSKFVFDTRSSGVPEPLSINSASGRIRFYGCEFVNNSPLAIGLNLFTFDTVTNITAEFYSCSSTETMVGSLTSGSEQPSVFNCNFAAGNVNYRTANHLSGKSYALAPAASTMFFAPQGNAITNIVTSDTAQQTRQSIGSAFEIVGLNFKASAAPGVGQTCTATVMTNGVATATVVTLSGASATSGTDFAHIPVSNASGDSIGLKVVTSASAATGRYDWDILYINR